MTTRFHFKIPYADKDRAKSMGARWDNDLKLWFAQNEVIREQMLEHWTELLPAKRQKCAKISNFFDISYNDATIAETKGAEWDYEKKRYFAPNEDVHAQLVLYWDQLTEPFEPSPFWECETLAQRDIPSDEVFTSMYFDVPWSQKNECKNKFHAAWDSSVKKWKATNKYMWEQLRLYFPPYNVCDEEELPAELPAEDLTLPAE